MLAQRYRFHGHGSLRRLFQRGRTARTRHLMIRYTPNPIRKDSRIAVIVSKKVCKSAVGRNRMRRRLFEIVRHGYLDIEGVYDIAITVGSPEVMTMPSGELTTQINTLLAALKRP